MRISFVYRLRVAEADIVGAEPRRRTCWATEISLDLDEFDVTWGTLERLMLCSRARSFFAVIVVMGIPATVWADVHIMTSGSMKPTFLVGDIFISVPLTFAEVQRGDVVVFRHPTNESVYVKRLIGLPGDTVQMKGGVLFLNGTGVPQLPNGTFEEVFEPQGKKGHYPRCENDPIALGGMCIASRFSETLPQSSLHPEGRTYDIISVEQNSLSDNTDSFKVPDEYFFVLGDNRDQSIDSRFNQAVGGTGFIASENLIGRIDRVLWSTSGVPGRTFLEID